MNEADSDHSKIIINHRKKFSNSKNDPECDPIDILYQIVLNEKKKMKIMILKYLHLILI